jgi:hypothetical protein
MIIMDDVRIGQSVNEVEAPSALQHLLRLTRRKSVRRPGGTG